MDYAAYEVVYFDERVSRHLDAQYIHKSGPGPPLPLADSAESSWEDRNPECLKVILPEIEEVRHNLRVILSIFNGVHICISEETCMDKVKQLDAVSTSLQPTLVIVEASLEASRQPHDDLSKIANATNSVSRTHRGGIALLKQLSDKIASSELSQLFVPIAMTETCEPVHSKQPREDRSPSRQSPGSAIAPDLDKGSGPVDPHRIFRCLEAGAVDVLTGPLQQDRVYGLMSHAFRAHKLALEERTRILANKRLRQQSWVGYHDTRPYAYLREDMVSGLMTGICNPESASAGSDDQTLPKLQPSSKLDMTKALASWEFSAHAYSDDELVHCASVMLQHTLDLPELEKWRLPADDLKSYLMACRSAYNSFVHYHNFRHVVDVMQAVFYFLLQLGILPPFPDVQDSGGPSKGKVPIASLLQPFDALTLLVSAIGHDVGHPGVNNAFLVTLNAPLAQLYNDKSVLEAFHCAAYSQILRRYWKSAFEDTSMRCLLINSILATDMGVHFKYMTDLGNLQEKLHHNGGTDGWSPQVLDDHRTLACGLLIKCADISNVARPFNIAAKWANILQLEFASQGVMEKDVGIPTQLFGGPPDLGNVVKLANSQIGFMNIFARPLFEGVADILPGMMFAVDEMKRNNEIWQERIKQNKQTDSKESKIERLAYGGHLSPRSGSPDRQSSPPEMFSHHEGLPASLPPSSRSAPSIASQYLEGSALAFQHLEGSREARRSSGGSGQHLLNVSHTDPYVQHSVSRRSSHGTPLDIVNAPSDTVSASRRSSGASPAASAMNPGLTTRRSSNTVPSQLQLSLGTDQRSQTPPARTTDEDLHPSRQGLEATASQVPHSVGYSYQSATAGGGGTGDAPRPRGSHKGIESESYQPQSHGFQFNVRSTRYSTNSPSLGRISASSGAPTSTTQSMPYSPTETQATSFLTVDSDDKSFRSEEMPDPINVDQQDSGRQYSTVRKSHDKNAQDVRTVVSNGRAGSMSPQSSERTVTRKSSRFRFADLWKKRGKASEASL